MMRSVSYTLLSSAITSSDAQPFSVMKISFASQSDCTNFGALPRGRIRRARRSCEGGAFSTKRRYDQLISLERPTDARQQPPAGKAHTLQALQGGLLWAPE